MPPTLDYEAEPEADRWTRFERFVAGAILILLVVAAFDWLMTNGIF